MILRNQTYQEMRIAKIMRHSFPHPLERANNIDQTTGIKIRSVDGSEEGTKEIFCAQWPVLVDDIGEAAYAHIKK